MTTQQGGLILLLFAVGGIGCGCPSTTHTAPGHLQPVPPPQQIGNPINPAGMLLPWSSPTLSQATSTSLSVRSLSQFLPCWRRKGFPHISILPIQDHTMRHLTRTRDEGISKCREKGGISRQRRLLCNAVTTSMSIQNFMCDMEKLVSCKGPILPLQWPSALFALKTFSIKHSWIITSLERFSDELQPFQ